MSVCIVLVCHNNESIQYVLNHNYNIIVVGNNIIKEEYQNNPKIIIARNLPINIEHEPKLLTFTAWYAISKNKLFTEYNHICILEYDVILDALFKSNLDNVCNQSYDIIQFVTPISHSLFSDINKGVLLEYLKQKNIYNINLNSWGPTTNKCMKIEILNEFVDWYYPSCLFIKLNDYKQLSWYHERIFAIYTYNKNFNHITCDGLKHIYLNSHKNLNST